MSAAPPSSDITPGEVRAGFVALVGLPNVGKSTLLNQILGVRLVAVSDKPQTTRNRIVGIHNATFGPDVLGEGPAAAQVIFVDTPGVQGGGSALRKYMQDEAMTAVADCDAAILLVDATDGRQRKPARLDEPDALALQQGLRAAGVPIVLALNKVDGMRAKTDLLPMIEAYDKAGFDPVMPISALTGDGVDKLVAAVAKLLPVGPRLFPDDMVTDRAERFLAGELIREQLFHQLGKELPYAAAVVVESFEERPSKKDVAIGAVIYVERESQKAIVVGKGGSRIKEIGIAARQAVGEFLGCNVHVSLHVKVRTDWSRGPTGLKEMGYE
jgi:GTPase